MSPKSTVLNRSYADIRSHSSRFAELFFRNLFERNAELAKLFQWIDMGEQQHRFMDVLEQIVDAADDAKALAGILEPLGKRHGRYGATMPLFQVFGEVLLLSLQQQLKDKWKADVEHAWIELYRKVVVLMAKGANHQPVEMKFASSAKPGAPEAEMRPEPEAPAKSTPPPAAAEPEGTDPLQQLTLGHARALLTRAIEQEVKQAPIREMVERQIKTAVEEQIRSAIAAAEREMTSNLKSALTSLARDLMKEIETDSVAHVRDSIRVSIQRVLRETVEQETARILGSMNKRAA